MTTSLRLLNATSLTKGAPGGGLLAVSPWRLLNRNGISYDPTASALFSRMTVQPSSQRKALINDLIVAGKAKSFWAKLDALWVHAAHDAQAGRLNWIADIYNCVPVMAPVFTVDRGYMGDGSSSYLDTKFNPATAVNPNFKQSSGALGIRSNTNNVGTGSLAGFYDTAANKGTTINPRATSSNNEAVYRVNQSSITTTSQGGSSPSAIGMFVANRWGSVDMRGGRNGVPIVGGGAIGGSGAAEPSVSPANGNFRLGSIHSASFRACEFSMGFVSAGLTNQELLDFFNWFEPYRQALGIT